jgi:predicted aminopeptidase
VNVFLHESVHATVYISNQSYFNESLAVFVSDKLTEKFFKDTAQDKTPAYQAYVSLQERSEKIRIRLNELYKQLKVLYDSDVSPEEKRTRKEAMIKALSDELHFKRKITNATLIQYETYHSSEDDFKMLYEALGRDIHRFMQVMKTLKDQDFSSPQQQNLKDVMEKLAKENQTRV